MIFQRFPIWVDMLLFFRFRFPFSPSIFRYNDLVHSFIINLLAVHSYRKMAQSRLHNVATIYTRLQGMVKVGAIAPRDTPLWFQVYERFPPRRPPDAERPLLPKKLQPILYPEDDLRAQYYQTFHSSNVTGDKGLMSTNAFGGGVCDVFRKSHEAVRRMRPDYDEEDSWYVTQRWIQDGLGMKLTHRGDRVTVAEMHDVERKVAKFETLNEEELKAFLEKVEKEEGEMEEESKEAGGK